MSGPKDFYPTLRNDPSVGSRRAEGNSSDTCSKRIVSLEQRDGTPDYILEKYSGEWFMKWRCSAQTTALGSISVVEAKQLVYLHAEGCGLRSTPPFILMS